LTPFSTGLPGAKRTQLLAWSFTGRRVSAEEAGRKELEQI
jgi:hypothetical protein